MNSARGGSFRENNPKYSRIEPRATKRLLSRPLATLSSIADGGEGRGEEVLSFVESARSTILGFMGTAAAFKRRVSPGRVCVAAAVWLKWNG